MCVVWGTPAWCGVHLCDVGCTCVMWGAPAWCGVHLPRCMYLKPVSGIFFHHSPSCLLSQDLSVKPRIFQSASLDTQPAPCLCLPDVWATCPALKWTLGISTQVFMLMWQAISPALSVIFVLLIFSFVYFIIIIYFYLCLLVFCAGNGTRASYMLSTHSVSKVRALSTICLYLV